MTELVIAGGSLLLFVFRLQLWPDTTTPYAEGTRLQSSLKAT